MNSKNNGYCKYHNKHMKTIKEYISCLYSIEGCCTGGLLHVMIDDSNIDDNTIAYTLGECLKHPEREESEIGKLICMEFLKLSIEERRFIVEVLLNTDGFCMYPPDCEKCPVTIGDDNYG